MHSLLKAALEAAPEAERPPPPYHGGVDANPQLGAFGFGGAAIFIAEAAAGLVRKTDRKRFDQLMAVSREIYEGHARGEGKEVKRGTKIHVVVLSNDRLKVLKKEITLPTTGVIGVDQSLAPALSAAYAAAGAAYDIEMRNGGSYVMTELRATLVRVVRALPAKEVRPFLLALDRRLVREELRAMLAERRDARSAQITECLWRAAAGRPREGRASGAKVTHWIGRLDDKSYVLLQKVGARWNVIGGSRDDVLATVPDGHMESATDAVFQHASA